MRALVTGATGFIGKHLCKRLRDTGWEVEELHRGPVAVKRKPDVVFHLASLFMVDHKSDDIPALIESNILLGTQLLEEVSPTYFVNAGTSWQHCENSEYEPVNLYAATKQAFEDILAYYISARSVSAMTLTLYDTYGPGDTRNKLVPLLLKNEHITMSHGEQRISLVYIDDVVDAFIWAASFLLTKKWGYYKYAVSSEPITLRDLVGEIRKIKPIDVEFSLPYRKREVMTPWMGSILPGWFPKTSLREGLIKCL